MDELNAICDGWGTNGSIIVSGHPRGGIIDVNLNGLGWYIIFNDDRSCSDWFETRDEAIKAFCNFSVDNVPESV